MYQTEHAQLKVKGLTYDIIMYLEQNIISSESVHLPGSRNGIMCVCECISHGALTLATLVASLARSSATSSKVLPPKLCLSS